MKKFPTKFAKYYVSEDGTVWKENKDGDLYVLKPHIRGGQDVPGGRYMGVNISLYDDAGKFVKQTKYYVHRLVGETLIPNPEGLPEIDHKNRIKEDNTVSNLRWSTKKTNMEWAAKEFKVEDEWTGNSYEGINFTDWVRNNWEWIAKRTKIKDPKKFAMSMQGKRAKVYKGLKLVYIDNK